MRLTNVDTPTRDAIILSELIALLLAKIQCYSLGSLMLTVEHISSPSFSNDDEDRDIIIAIIKHIEQTMETNNVVS